MEPWLEHVKTQVQVYSMFCSVALFSDIPPMTVTHSSCLFMKPFFLIYLFVFLARNIPNGDFPQPFTDQDKWQHQPNVFQFKIICSPYCVTDNSAKGTLHCSSQNIIKLFFFFLSEVSQFLVAMLLVHVFFIFFKHIATLPIQNAHLKMAGRIQATDTNTWVPTQLTVSIFLVVHTSNTPNIVQSP